MLNLFNDVKVSSALSYTNVFIFLWLQKTKTNFDIQLFIKSIFIFRLFNKVEISLFNNETSTARNKRGILLKSSATQFVNRKVDISLKCRRFCDVFSIARQQLGKKRTILREFQW